MFKGGFKIAKRNGPKVRKVQQRGFEKAEDNNDDMEVIKSIDENGKVEGTNIKKKNEELVIACIKVNRWKGPDGNKRKAKVDIGAENANKKQFKEADNDDVANAIIQDANRYLQVQAENAIGKEINIPLMAINKVPQGFEEDVGNLKVDVRPDESNLDDYDSVPIQKFGLGMLRGMGWTEEEGIGKNKQKISEIRPTVRPKGLGLGAIPVSKKKEEVKKEYTHSTEMRKGSLVKIIGGPYKGRYGKVLSLDGDLGRVTVQWALGKHGKPSELLEGFAEIVSKKEYDDCGKDISRANKSEIEKRRKKDEKARKLKKIKASATKPAGVKWCHVGLIIKFVGDEKSKHYNKKFEIRNVLASESIYCRDLISDKISEFNERDLETVIPKNMNQVMMVIRGSVAGEFGKLIEKDKKKEIVMLELFNGSGDVERIKFDDSCEFNALAADFDD